MKEQLTKEQIDFLKFCTCYNMKDQNKKIECYETLISKGTILRDHDKVVEQVKHLKDKKDIPPISPKRQSSKLNII